MSNLDAYARQFWRREHGKGTRKGGENYGAVVRGADPVELLRRAYNYKLPQLRNVHISIAAFISGNEVQNLFVHDYMPNDNWMKDRGLVPDPFTRRLGTLAEICLERNYFASERNDRQIRYFNDWRKRSSLANVLSNDERPLIELTQSMEHEIVDGWGRLLSFAALLLQGLPFKPFQVFYASPITSSEQLVP